MNSGKTSITESLKPESRHSPAYHKSKARKRQEVVVFQEGGDSVKNPVSDVYQDATINEQVADTKQSLPELDLHVSINQIKRKASKYFKPGRSGKAQGRRRSGSNSNNCNPKSKTKILNLDGKNYQSTYKIPCQQLKERTSSAEDAAQSAESDQQSKSPPRHQGFRPLKKLRSSHNASQRYNAKGSDDNVHVPLGAGDTNPISFVVQSYQPQKINYHIEMQKKIHLEKLKLLHRNRKKHMSKAIGSGQIVTPERKSAFEVLLENEGSEDNPKST